MSVAFAGSASSLDPIKQTNPAEYSFQSLLFDTLTRVSADGNSVDPRLATSWTFADDGSYLELKLRDDVTFHDGTPFDAEAVKANIERGQQTEGSTVTAALASVTGVEVVDETTVRLLLDGGGAELPAMLGSAAGMMVSPKAIESGQDLAQSPGDAGSGAYVVDQFKPGESVTYKKSEDYWDDEVADRAGSVTVTLVPQTASRINGVIAGQYDLGQITGIDVPQALSEMESGKMEGYKRPVRTSFWVYMNTTKPPLDNLQIRQAINYAVDRDAIGGDLYSNSCTPTYQIYNDEYFAYDPELADKYKLDLEKAKSLVAESGVSNPTITLEVGTQSAYEPAAQALQSQLAEAGITVKLSPIPQADVFSRFNAGTSQSALTGVVPGADPSVWVANYLTSGSNLTRGDSKLADEVNDLAKQAVDPTLDEKARGDLYRQIQQAASDNALFAQICSSEHLWVHNDKVTGIDENWTGVWSGLPDFGGLTKTG